MVGNEDEAAGPSLTLILELPGGTLIRQIPNASPLPPADRQGTAAETATQEAATIWGLPDFIFTSRVDRVGSGTRELGDTLLVVGRVGVVVQVKSREALSQDNDRERRWIAKSVHKGLNQATGTVRRLMSAETLAITNARDKTVEISPAAFRWVSVVVIDHPSPPEDVTPVIDGRHPPAVVLLRRDWEFLFDQLKSVHSVGVYLHRVAGEALPLGDEPVRYHELAQADADAEPSAPPHRLPGWTQPNRPLLPLETQPADELAHRLFRYLFEDIAVSAILEGEDSETLRFQVLGALDSLPITIRGETGRYILAAFEKIRERRAANRTSREPAFEWQLRRIVGGSAGPLEGYARVQLAFGAALAPRDVFQSLLRSWTLLRHHDMVAEMGDDLTTVALVVTPRPDGCRPFDTTMMAYSGPIELDAEEIADFREFWDGHAGEPVIKGV